MLLLPAPVVVVVSMLDVADGARRDDAPWADEQDVATITATPMTPVQNRRPGDTAHHHPAHL